MGNLRNITEIYAKFSLFFFPCYAVLSFAFNYMYFYVLGIDLEKIPLSSLDYIMSFNIFGLTLAVTLLTQTSALLLGFYRGKQECLTLSNADEQARQSHFKRAKRERIFLSIISACSVFLCAAILYNFDIIHMNFVLLMPFAFASLIFSNLKKEISFPLAIFITLLLFTLNGAKSDAISNYNSAIPETEINSTTCTIMRIFEKGFLVKEKETQNILFITEQNIKINYTTPKYVIKYNERMNSK